MGGWWPTPGYKVLLLYMFHKVNRDISRALNAPSLDGVEDGGDALPGLCPIGGGVPLLNSLFNSFTYSTMRASNSDGAIPGIGPRATQFLQTLVRHAIFQDIDLGLCKCRANTGRRERIKRAISDPSGEPFVGEHLAIEKLGAASTNRVSKPSPLVSTSRQMTYPNCGFATCLSAPRIRDVSPLPSPQPSRLLFPSDEGDVYRGGERR